MNLTDGYRVGDTIAAMITPPGRGGVSTIRVSGPDSPAIVSLLFEGVLPEAGRHRFGLLKSPVDGGVIDEAVVAVFKAPHSYTAEDVVEISCHGSPLVVGDVLGLLFNAGARPASPGEFTLRAFLNGRIDLTQAEAVADIIAADSREAAGQAVRQMRGALAESAGIAGDLISKGLALCELELDFVEDDVEIASMAEKRSIIRSVLTELSKLLAGYETARRLREGVRVAIAGPPNVGKSSLFNALVGEQRAIVHPRPGTTRDVLRAPMMLNGIRFELFDTAGVRESSDEIEDEGIRRAKQAAEEAELVISLSSVDIATYDIPQPNGVKVLRVMNKIDLLEGNADVAGISISARDGAGIDSLKGSLYEMATGGGNSGAAAINRERHYRAVTAAKSALEKAINDIDAGASAEIIAECLREALEAVDSLTGKRQLDTLLDDIFSKFCIGK